MLASTAVLDLSRRGAARPTPLWRNHDDEVNSTCPVICAECGAEVEAGEDFFADAAECLCEVLAQEFDERDEALKGN